MTLRHIPHMHYSDLKYAGGRERSLHGQKCKELTYVYSDRIWQWDYKKAEASAEKAKASEFPPNTVEWYEVFLSHFYDKELEIPHLMGGCNAATGYEFLVFGYCDKGTKLTRIPIPKPEFKPCGRHPIEMVCPRCFDEDYSGEC